MKKTYMVKGGERNCEVGYRGCPSNMPILGYFKGEYEEVLAYAKKLDGWKAWSEGELIVIDVIEL